MKPTYPILAAAVAVAAGTASIASAQPRTANAHSSRAAVISTRHTSLGTVLVSSSGRTLYEFTKDHANHDSCVSIGGCSEVWPALKSSGRPTAGTGVRASLLSTTRLSGGGLQVTYAGHPLYLYSGDSGPAETSYVGAHQFGGSWYALSSGGQAIR